MTKYERTGWRDEALSLRHRDWGMDCPMLDLDFVVVEYDHCQPQALVEYKHELAKIQHLDHPSYRTLVSLGNLASLPAFFCRYAGDFSWWKPVGLNRAAKLLLPDRVNWSERDWVTFLYLLRGRGMPVDLFAQVAV